MVEVNPLVDARTGASATNMVSDLEGLLQERCEFQIARAALAVHVFTTICIALTLSSFGAALSPTDSHADSTLVDAHLGRPVGGELYFYHFAILGFGGACCCLELPYAYGLLVLTRCG